MGHLWLANLDPSFSKDSDFTKHQSTRTKNLLCSVASTATISRMRINSGTRFAMCSASLFLAKIYVFFNYFSFPLVSFPVSFPYHFPCHRSHARAIQVD